MASIIRLHQSSELIPELTLSSDSDVSHLQQSLASVESIAIEFPNFADGRGYSHARLLRERFNYKGVLRATGNVLFDQLAFMLRCGFDEFEISNEEIARHGGIELLRQAFDEITLAYQPALDNIRHIRQLRGFS